MVTVFVLNTLFRLRRCKNRQFFNTLASARRILPRRVRTFGVKQQKNITGASSGIGLVCAVLRLHDKTARRGLDIAAWVCNAGMLRFGQAETPPAVGACVQS